jgi:transglutaminase-like putative cysteine protease
MKDLDKFLEESTFIDISHPNIQALAKDLAQEAKNDMAIAKRCFLFVRDEIRHSGDYKDDTVTCKASDVLRYKTGWCYAKSHLLAALLRANGIPTALTYQRLSCSEYEKDIYCLHGLNAVYLKEYGWYHIDARGNKEGVDAQFLPPVEQLAFFLQDNEYDFEELYAEPLEEVVHALTTYKSYKEIVTHLPDATRR